MGASFYFEHRLNFIAADAAETLSQVPAAPGVFALRGPDPKAEPYITRAADLRRRLRRLLAPPELRNADGTPQLSKRLNLRDRVATIEYSRTGSEFESLQALYAALRSAFGEDQARKRLRLYPPYAVRLTLAHEHPRLYVTNRISARSLRELFGPFPSRAAAERFCDGVLDLFQLRRCFEDLVVHPDHPGCAYGEMKRCGAPCKGACTAEEYAAESQRVLAFLRTRGESMLGTIAAEREHASNDMDFERAASLHKQWEKVKAAAALADEVMKPLYEVRALIVQEACADSLDEPGARPERVSLFLLEAGRLCGPVPLSTLGVRAVREQTAVGSSLFAQPLMLAAIPLDEAQFPASPAMPAAPSIEAQRTPEAPASTPEPVPLPAVTPLSPEARAEAAIHELEGKVAAANAPTPAEVGDALSLFRRWYYRPEKQRTGEVFLPSADGSWPIRRLLNGAARVALGPPAQLDAVNREAAREALKAQKTKVIHEGREGVERTVPVLPKRSRSRKAITPADIV